MAERNYVLRGGAAGRERLRMLARVLLPTTQDLFERVKIPYGAACLDVGCGGGDVALELARRVGPEGSVCGIDFDSAIIELARQEAQAEGFDNVRFMQADIRRYTPNKYYDLVYARFLLTHLADPVATLQSMHALLRPGGKIIIEDIDFRGHFCYPESPAFERYVDLYSTVVRQRGADPHIGPRLPEMIARCAFTHLEMKVVQPAGISGEVKLIAALTMENIADAVIDGGLARPEDVERIVSELYTFARQDYTLMSLPRIVQVWAMKA